LRKTDDEEFTAFVERHSRFVFRVAYAVLRNSHDAEDAAQEMFFRLYRKGGWHGLEDEKAFLARSTWRIAVDRLRQRQPAEDEADMTEFLATQPSPEQAAIAGDMRMLVQELVDRLPEQLRQPLALSAIEEMNSKEIAAAMAIPEGTVRTRLMRARELLREKLNTMEAKAHVRQRS
jgi:RNA polymerase sigma-70 factor, ECF subfamily